MQQRASWICDVALHFYPARILDSQTKYIIHQKTSQVHRKDYFVFFLILEGDGFMSFHLM